MWFPSQAKTAIKTLKSIARKSKRLKWHQNKLSEKDQRTLMNSYAISRVLYATPIWLTHASNTSFKEIETKLRGIGKSIYGAQMQTGTTLFELATNL